MALFVNVGMPSTSFSVYQPYLAEMLGDEGGSIVVSVRTFATLAAMFVVNRYYTRLDCRIAIFVGTLLTAAGFACYSLADSLPLFAAGALLSGIGYSFGGMVGMTLLIGRWYKVRVGTAVGIATVGSGCAGTVVPAIAVQIIHGASLHASFAVEALFALAVALLALAVIRNHPHDMGMEPFGEGSEEAGQAQHKVPGRMSSHGDAHLHRRVRAFLICAMACVGMTAVGGMSYLSILMTTNGFDPGFAAGMLSVAGVFLMLSKFGTGELFDKAGTLKGTVAIFALCLLGLALCWTVPLGLWPLAVAAAAFYGVGVAIGSVGISVWSLELSNPATRAKTVKDFQVGYALGGFIGGTFPGFLAGACGSYVPAYYIIFAATLFAALTIVSVYRRYR